jgi:hypothetical protein
MHEPRTFDMGLPPPAPTSRAFLYAAAGLLALVFPTVSRASGAKKADYWN